jgi:hypothetical protein
MAEDRALPGWPKKKLVKAVRRHLSSYGIRPASHKLWHEAWAWASRIAQSYFYPRWPLPSEIAAQYILLLLLEIKANRGLKLPFRAMQHMPPTLRQSLATNPVPLIGMKKEIEGHVALRPAQEGQDL